MNENTACIVSDLLLHIHVRVFISDDSVASGGFDVAHLQESLTTFIQKFASKGQYIIFIFIFWFDFIQVFPSMGSSQENPDSYLD